jgi:hypothetical protein
MQNYAGRIKSVSLGKKVRKKCDILSGFLCRQTQMAAETR